MENENSVENMAPETLAEHITSEPKKRGEKRPVGRPTAGTIKWMLSVHPETRERIKSWAESVKMTPGQYLDWLARR